MIVGRKPPEEIFVFIEGSKGSKNIYKYDKHVDKIILEKTIEKLLPFCYGFIPATHHNGQPLYAIVLTTYPLIEGSLIQARPVGFIRLEEKIEIDSLLITVSLIDKYKNIMDVSEISKKELKDILDFLKILTGSKAKAVFNSEHAKKALINSIELYKREFG